MHCVHAWGQEIYLLHIYAIGLLGLVKVKVKDTALDFTVRTGGADLRFLALQPGSAMGGWGQAILLGLSFRLNNPLLSTRNNQKIH